MSKESFLRQHFRLWQEGGLTIPEYCELERLSRSTFGYWRTRVRKAAARTEPNSLVEVKLPEAEMSSPALVHIRLADGLVLRVNQSSEVGYVAGLVKALEQR